MKKTNKVSGVIEHGDRVKDVICGASGIVIGITDWIYGCRRITVQIEKPNEKGKPQDAFTVDEPQLTIVKKSVIERSKFGVGAAPAPRTHGPRDDASPRADATR
jgi:hypothetical protein